MELNYQPLPLPSQRPRSRLDEPRTPYEWRKALSQAQKLVLDRQYKEAQKFCERVSKFGDQTPDAKPLHRASMLFYCASAYELQALSQHMYSKTRIDSFEAAKTAYKASLVHWPTPSVEYLLQSDPWAGVGNEEDDEGPGTAGYVRTRLSTATASWFSTVSEPPSPPSSPGTPARVHFNDTIASKMEDRAIERYNRQLARQIATVHERIQALDEAIKETEQAQASRHTRQRLPSKGADPSFLAAEKQARLKRLKASGWRLERFDPGKYRKLSEEALLELGL